MICTNCGTELVDNAKFCTSCGTPVQAAPAAPVQQAPVAPVAPVAAPIVTPVAPVAAPVAAPAQPKKKKKGLLIALLILIPVLIIGGVVAWLLIDKSNDNAAIEEKYESALDAIEDGKYDEAAKLLKELDDYEDSEELLEKLNNYTEAKKAIEEGKYEDALELLKKADDIADAEKLHKELSENLEAYEQARTALDAKDFVTAETLLKELNGLLDSKELLETELPYQKAVFLMDCASGSDLDQAFDMLEQWGEELDRPRKDYEAAIVLYDKAAEILEDVSEHKDAKTCRAECWYKAGELCIENAQLDRAEDYLALLKDDSADRADELEELLLDQYADGKFLEGLQEALSERVGLSQAVEFDRELLEPEQELLDELADLSWLDSDLEKLYDAYVEAMQTQWNALDSNEEYIENYTQWLYGTYERVLVIEELNKEYGFLEDDEDLKESYVGTSELVLSYAVLEEELNAQLFQGPATYDAATGKYYLPFENTTDYEFTLTLYLDFYLGEELVEMAETDPVKIGKGEVVRLYIPFPDESVAWDNWYIYWNYDEISLDGQML